MDRTKFLFCLTVAILSIGIARSPRIVKATQVEPGFTVFAVSQFDLNDDGRPDLTEIDASFTQNRDRILVYDQGEDMLLSDDWSVATDFKNDVWIFDAGVDNAAELIIQFAVEDGRQVAYLYDDQDGDASVSYQINENFVEITESPYWTYKVISGSNWFFENGSINFALEILSDAGLVGFPYAAAVEATKNYLVHDGEIDSIKEIVDEDEDGVPDYDLNRLVGPVPNDWGVFRTNMSIRLTPQLPPLQDYTFWPMLGDASKVATKPDETYPPLRIDWSTAKVSLERVIAEYYPPDRGWLIGTVIPLTKGVLNELNFEYPMAWYDLAERQDGRPDLHIRFSYIPPHDPFFYGGAFPKPIEMVRYSWDQDHDLSWDFALHLIGRHRIESEVPFSDFSLRTVPYTDLPSWIQNRPWDSVVFVAVEEDVGWSSEGIYEFGGWQTLRDRYITGFSPDPPLDEYKENLPVGYRMDLNFQLADQPNLYLSPIDGKLHLKGAIGGMWRVDDQSWIEYQDLNEDGYVDYWQYYDTMNVNDLERETANKTLIHLEDYILLANNQNRQVELVKKKIDPFVFETLPPGNPDEWSSLKDQLSDFQELSFVSDFEAMLSQFSERPTLIDGAAMDNFQINQKGFTFALHLEPGFRVEASDLLPGLENLVAGSYLFEGSDKITISDLKPAQVSFVEPLKIAPSMPKEYENVDVDVVIKNTGDEGVNALPITFFAEAPDGETFEIDKIEATLLGGGIKELSTHWMPNRPGEWVIKTELDTSEANPPVAGGVMGTEIKVKVEAAQQPGWQDLQVLSGGSVIGLGVAILFVCLVFVALLAIRLSLTG